MGGSLKIKVCGMRDPANLEALCGLGPDFVGFIFYKASPRYVGKDPDPALFGIPGSRTSRVGVFVNEPLQSLRNMVERGWFDMVQLHGNESPSYCKTLVNEGMHVIKAISSEKIRNARFLQSYFSVVHYFLLDTPTAGHGGSGRKFDWSLMDAYQIPVPFFLSGGIGPEDAVEIRDLKQLWFRGVDLNSRFEKEPGVKDMQLLSSFMNEIRKI